MSSKGKYNADQLLAIELSKYFADPLGYVMFAFPWDSEPSIQMVELAEPWRSRFKCKWGPDKWACEFLDQWGEEIKKRGFKGQDAVDPIKFSTASGHGIGKSALCAWISKFILDTRPHSKGTITAGTDGQLRTKTWAELGKWHRMSITRNWFNWTTGRGAMALVHVKHPQWALTAQTCREENSESFAGQHAIGATSFYIFDEASQIPDKIYEVREGGTVVGEPMIFDFGNPTRKSGEFYESHLGRSRHRYITRQIDSRSVAVTNKKLHAQWIADHGIESDFVKVRILGQFPSAGTLQFIPSDLVEAAAARDTFPNPQDPLIIGVDVARFGDDDSVIYPRIGNDARSFPVRRFKKQDTVIIAAKVIDCIKEFRELGKKCQALFVDGGGVGGGVVDQLRHLGYNPIEVNFGATPNDSGTYRFKVDEMWGNLKDALAKRLAIPADRGENSSGGILKQQLTQREFGYTIAGNKINLESKADMKERLGGDYASPDVADALALTFAQEILVENNDRFGAQEPLRAQDDYDPHAYEVR